MHHPFDFWTAPIAWAHFDFDLWTTKIESFRNISVRFPSFSLNKFISIIINTLQFLICYGTNGNKMRGACCVFSAKKCRQHTSRIGRQIKLFTNFRIRHTIHYELRSKMRSIWWIGWNHKLNKKKLLFAWMLLGYTFLPAFGWHLANCLSFRNITD